MRNLKTRVWLLLLLPALASCQSAPVVQPRPMACQAPPAAPAWAMVPPPQLSFTERMQRIFKLSSPTQTPLRQP